MVEPLPLSAEGAAPQGVAPDPEAKGGKEKKEEEKTFFQKYWYYIVPLVVMMVLPGGDPNEGKPQGKPAAAASS